MYDLIIIGAGPAGVTASIYAARKKMDFLVISKNVGGQALWIGNIENYTGFPLVSGQALVEKFNEQLNGLGTAIKEGETVTELRKDGDIVKITTDKAQYLSRTVIITSGRTPKKLMIKGEKEFLNKGVAYCATCDAPVFAGKDVIVVGGANSAMDAALQLTKYANKVFLSDTELEFRADPLIVQNLLKNGKVTVLKKTKLLEIYGAKFVQGVKLEKNGLQEDLKVDGVFIEIGSTPLSSFAEGVARNENGEILIDCSTMTNVPGIFAAGDVTDVSAKQLIVACGEGAKAAISAFEYVNNHK